MKCPKCETISSIAERQGIEIDVCPQCRGVWLDRGELDKIISRSERFFDDDDDDRYKRDDRYKHPEYREQRQHKRKSFWQELFD